MSFSRFAIPSKFFEWENKYENSNFSSTFTCFLNSKHFFTKLLKFSFIELHETNSFTLDWKNTFSSKSHAIQIRIDWNMFLHDPTWKYHLMKPCSFFSFKAKFHCPHMILVVQPVCQVCEFKNLLNSDSHEKWKSSRKLLKIQNQASEKFSSLLFFKLSFTFPDH